MREAITEKMDKVESEMQDHFSHLYCKRDFERQLMKARSAKRDSVLFCLRDLASMLNAAGVKCEYEKPISYYEKLIDGMNLSENEDFDQKVMDLLYRKCSEYPGPETFMRRIVNSLDSASDPEASVRLRIFRRFMETVNVPENEKNFAPSLIDTDPYEIEESMIDPLNPQFSSACDYGRLAQMADCLASGKFVSENVIKEALFLLAFAYGMQYYEDASDAQYDVARDVEKNLFADYYCDNLVRYMGEEGENKGGISVKEPDGMALDPKNLVDVLFIYCLNRKDFSPKEKTAFFYSTVNSVKEKWDKANKYNEEGLGNFGKEKDTKESQRSVAEVVLNLAPSDLEDYLLENYYCDFRYLREYEETVPEYTYDSQVGYWIRFDGKGKDGTLPELRDHVCIRDTDGKNVIAAIELCNAENESSYAPVEKDCLTAKKKLIGSEYFAYDEKKKVYVRAQTPKRGERKIKDHVLSSEFRLTSLSPFDYKLFSKSAFEQYEEILALIRDEMMLPEDFNFAKEFKKLDGRGLLKDRISRDDDEFYDKEFEIYKKQMWENSNPMSLLGLYENIPIFEKLKPREGTKEGLARFWRIMEDITERLDPKMLLSFSKPDEISRTKLIALYYHFYCWTNLGDTDDGRWMSFADIYRDFSMCINGYLDDAGYQKISTKNLYDVFIIFFAYCKINCLLS